jgi:hypothetical protein
MTRKGEGEGGEGKGKRRGERGKGKKLSKATGNVLFAAREFKTWKVIDLTFKKEV